jgi:poly-gamma-glutamate synthesis protein (capsule biosynthesis protein)
MSTESITLFLCGDVMTGRGIDQALPHPSRPQLFEDYARSALDYVALAEAVNGPIHRPIAPADLWGDALAEFERRRPDVRIANLETAVTASDDAWPGKGIHYRMHPANVRALTAARLDCCVLANNHVLDWGHDGLAETLDVLARAGIRTAGAGRDARQAAAPAVCDVPPGHRVLVFGFCTEDSGVPREWAATPSRAGVALLRRLDAQSAAAIAAQVSAVRRSGDIVVASIHWGGNWDFAIPATQREFAHRLIDEAGVDLVHGHSSHHVKGIEVHRGRLILYGCGDFVNDYEGIAGHERWRGDLALMYFATLDAGSGALVELAMTPTRMHRFRVRRGGEEDAQWLAATLTREGRPLGTRVERLADGTLVLRWAP